MSRSISRRNQFHIGQITGGLLPQTTVNANSTVTSYTTVNIPKTGVNDVVIVTVQNPTQGIIYDGYVSASGVVTIRASNITTSNITPGGASPFQVQVHKR